MADVKRTVGWDPSRALVRAVTSTELEGGSVTRGQQVRIERYQTGRLTAQELRDAGVKRAAER